MHNPNISKALLNWSFGLYQCKMDNFSDIMYYYLSIEQLKILWLGGRWEASKYRRS